MSIPAGGGHEAGLPIPRHGARVATKRTYVYLSKSYVYGGDDGDAGPQERVPRPDDAQAGAGDPRPTQRVRGDPRGARAGRLSGKGDEGLRPRRRERPRLRGRVAATVSSRLVFDTSVYIAILRDGRFAASFRERYRRDVPRTHMCSVVAAIALAERSREPPIAQDRDEDAGVEHQPRAHRRCHTSPKPRPLPAARS